MTSVDPLGLVTWDIEMSGGAFVYGGGAGGFEFRLTSKECLNGKRATAVVHAAGPAIGLGAKWTLPFTGADSITIDHTYDDGYDYFNFENMEGLFILDQASFGIGVAGYALLVGFGQVDLKTDSGGIHGVAWGTREGTIEGGAFSVVGSAWLVSKGLEDCGDCVAGQ